MPEEKKKVDWKKIYDLTIRILMFGILVFVSIVVVRHYQTWVRGPQSITITKYLQPQTAAEHVAESFLNKKVKPDTVYLSDTTVKIDTVLYSNPWGILDLNKDGIRIRASAYRSKDKTSDEGYLREYVWTLRDAKKFHIYSTKDPNNPFELRERRDLFDVSMEFGWSAVEKPYVETGVWYSGLRIKNFMGDLGLVSHVSFKEQDLRLGYRVQF